MTNANIYKSEIIMLFLIFSVLAFSYDMILTGEWGDTFPSEEAYEFFEYLHPEYLNIVAPILKEKQRATSSEIISSLPSAIPSKIVTLLMFALQTRYFNPRAITKVKEPRPNVTLNMWGAVKREWGQKIDENQILKILQVAVNDGSYIEKIEKLGSIVENFMGYYDLINKATIGNDTEKWTYFPSKTQFAAVNGRVVKMDAMEVVHAIFQEYKLSNTIKHFGITNQAFLYQRPGRQVHHVTRMLEHAPILEYHEQWKNRLTHWAKKLSQSKDYTGFLKYKDNLAEVQIFMRVGNPVIPYVMETIRNFANAQYPARFHMFLFGNWSDPNERLFTTAFWRVCDNTGARIGATFLYEASTMGLKKAYKRTTCDTRWRKIKNLHEDQFIGSRMNNTWKYCMDRNITQFAYNVNGEFFYDDPLFEKITERMMLVSKQVNQAMKLGLDTEKVSFPDWFQSDGIKIETTIPLEITASNRITISDKNAGIVENAIDSLYNGVQNIPEDQINSSKVSVFTIGYKINDTNCSHVMTNYKESVDEHVKKLFGQNVKTIVGPFVFDEELTPEQIEYCAIRTNYTYHHGLNFGNIKQRHFIEIFRAEEDFAKRKRANRPPVNQKSVIMSRQGQVNFRLIANPAYRTIWPMIGVMRMLAQVESVGVEFYPSAVATNPENDRQISSGRYYSAFGTGVVSFDQPHNIGIDRPQSWELKHINGKWTVPGIVVTGYVNSSMIRIGPEYRKPLSDGYFAAVLPPGSHSCQGFEDNLFYVDSFVPTLKIYRPGKSVDRVPRNDNSGLYMFMWYPDSYWRAKWPIYTFYANVSRSCPLLLIDPFVSIVAPHDITTIFLPNFVPHFSPKPTSNLMFVKTAKYYYPGMILPSNIDKVIFADEALVFRGDATRLSRVDWKNASVCAIESNDNKKTNPINSWTLKTMRLGRPYHSPALICFCVSAYIEQGGPEVYLDLMTTKARAKNTMGYGDEEYMNIIQLKIQFLTLPQETLFNANFMKRKQAKYALAHVRSADKSDKYLGTRIPQLNREIDGFFKEL